MPLLQKNVAGISIGSVCRRNDLSHFDIMLSLLESMTVEQTAATVQHMSRGRLLSSLAEFCFMNLSQ